MHGLTARGRRGQPLPGHCESAYDGGEEREQPAMRPLKEDSRDKRRTVADALEVIRQEPEVEEMAGAEIRVSPFELPSGEATAVVAVVCPDFDCFVSLPASWWFTALSEKCSQRQRFEIPCLGVEMVPSHMPYAMSPVEQRILWHVIALTESYDCYRNLLRDDLPPHLQAGIQELWVLDYGRLHIIPRCLLKVIKAHIEAHDPKLRVSTQKIADTLAKCGVRVPRRRLRMVI